MGLTVLTFWVQLKTCTEIYQKLNENFFEWISGVIIYIEDVMIVAGVEMKNNMIRFWKWCGSLLMHIKFNIDSISCWQSDASKFWLKCYLLQDKRPVSFVSRSLSETEVNYPHTQDIDKEFLAITFACNFIIIYLW